MKTTTSKWFTGVIGALVVLGILIAVNLLFSGVRLRKDLTEEKQYTLSEGTATMLQELQRPVEDLRIGEREARRLVDVGVVVDDQNFSRGHVIPVKDDRRR